MRLYDDYFSDDYFAGYYWPLISITAVAPAVAQVAGRGRWHGKSIRITEHYGHDIRTSKYTKHRHRK